MPTDTWHVTFSMGFSVGFRFLFADEFAFSRYPGMEGFEDEYSGCNQSEGGMTYEEYIGSD